MESPDGASGFRFKAKPVAVVLVVAAVDVTVDALEAVPGAFKLKPSAPVPGVVVEVAGGQSERLGAVDEAGAVAMEAKSVGPVLVVVAAGAGAAGWVAPAAVATGVAGVNGNPDRAVGCAALPREPTLKPEVPD